MNLRNMNCFTRLVVVLLAGHTWTAAVQASNVVEFKELDFDNWVGNGKLALIEFWAPWCDHCTQLDPVYQKLGDSFAHVKDKLAIAKMNSDYISEQGLQEKFPIAALPTIKWFGADGETEEYDPLSGRTLEELAQYITQKSGLKARLPRPPPPPPPATVELTPGNFDSIVNDPAKDVLVAFTATWCPHCEAMKPKYDLISSWFRAEKNVVIANIDSDMDVNKALARKYGVKGYPILKLFPRGSTNKTPIDFEAPRDEKNFLEFLNKHTGTQRAMGGGLDDKAGRSETLDEIVKDFMVTDPSRREAIYKRAEEAAAAEGKYGKQYLRIMEKLMNGPDDFLTEENKRLFRLLLSKTLADDKLDEIKIKYNILSTFAASAAAQRVEDGVRVERSARRPLESASSSEDALETEMKRTKEEL